MVEPVSTAIILGVAGNLATSVVQHGGRRLINTKVGRSLNRKGLLKPDFEKRLERVLKEATVQFLNLNSEYNISEVHKFLESKVLARDISLYLLEGKQPDIEKISNRLAQYVGVPLENAPEFWPNRIVPSALIDSLLSELQRSLGADADPALIWLSQSVAQIASKVDALALRVDQAALELSSISVALGTQAGVGKHSEFEAGYKSYLRSRFQKVTTPGARELHGVGQTLSVAYISLNVKSESGAEPIRAEQFLSDNPLVAIRGPAGSGKTTLLSWIVTRCAAEPDNENPWSGKVPFFVPLRTVARVEEGPPNLNSLVRYSVDPNVWSRATPDDWLEDVLSCGRAVIMIDGVDELPQGRRSEFWDWVSDTVDAHPGNSIVITSRVLPGTLQPSGGKHSGQWNPPANFEDAHLQEMSNADVTEFIHHWHDAVLRENLDDGERAALDDARASLPAKLEDSANRRIRELCGTPLLCAMVCVLHWREEGYLPHYRVDLYDKCCEMLVEARDLKRKIQAPSGSVGSMTKNDKEMVLQRLAIEMMQNRPDGDEDGKESYRIEISRQKAMTWLSPLINSFQQANAREAKAEDVLNFLIERTGLLREPATDLIDFPHRTFQEYLAACAAGAEGKEDFLAKQADDDQWHETIMLAAGTTTGGVGFGRSLIEALIKRGERHKSKRERQQKIRKTCFALALGCLENLRQQDPDLRERVLSNLGELVPPRNDGDARILSVAGDAAVTHLAYSKWSGEDVQTVASCGRALRLIGTAEAIRSLGQGYVSDVRSTVVSEVCKSEAFAYSLIPSVRDKVQRDGRLPDFAETGNLELLKGLDGLRSLTIDVQEVRHPNLLCDMSGLRDVRIGKIDLDNPQIELPLEIESILLTESKGSSLIWLSKFNNLSRLTIAFNKEIKNAEDLSKISTLKSIHLLGASLGDINIISKLSNLENLTLTSCRFFADSFPELPNLRELDLDDCPDINSVSFLSKLPSLRRLSFQNVKISGDLSIACLKAIESLKMTALPEVQRVLLEINAKALKEISILGCPDLLTIVGIEDCATLRSLMLESVAMNPFPSLEKVRDLQRLSLVKVQGLMNDSLDGVSESLEYLEIMQCPDFSNFDMISKIAGLKTLAIGNSSRLNDLNFLNGSKVNDLTILNCDGIRNLNGVEGMDLTKLSLLSLDGLEDIDSIRTLKGLTYISLRECFEVKSFDVLNDLENLETIDVDTEMVGKIPSNLHDKVRSSHYYPQWRYRIQSVYSQSVYVRQGWGHRLHLPHRNIFYA